MEKRLLGWGAWSEPQRGPAETTEVVLPLANIDGIGIQGVQLRINTYAYRRLHESTAILEVGNGRQAVGIARVDGWPADPHMNGQARRSAKLSLVPPVVTGSHVHRFRDNARLGIKAFKPPGNLPVAVPLPEPLTGFRGFLRTVGREFNIVSLEEFDPPPWQEYLL